ncbi:MAG TPA: hypothetical protein VFV35_01115, partial [Acidimicrobiales bacterium]|nr:hypothetical protein [Acidimicrobiales bacterium]
MDLSGTWRAAPADEPLRRAYPQPAFDDDGWEPIEVPGHWRTAAAFANSDGPLLLRRSFDHSVIDDGRRAWLTFEGIFYQADVWLDGGYLGDAEGYFAPQVFEVTEPLRARREHVVAVEVTCPPQEAARPRRNITGAFQAVPPAWNPGGVWRPVRLRTTGQLAITRLRVLCLEATAERALLSFDATVDAATPTDASMHTTISSGAGVHHVEAARLSKGPNRVEWRVAVEAPSLWWPHALGEPELVDVEVAVVTPEGTTSDRRRLRTGIRQVRMSSWVVAVNGERLFLKGANLGPSKLALGEAAPDELDRDVAIAVEAGLDLLRLQAHVSRPELYDAADRHGLLLWQDLPIQAGLARHVRKEAVRQARQAVDLLGHHPSVALWCGHDEPVTTDTAHVVRAGLAGLALPTYNKTVLDGSLHRALHRADPSRPVVPHSGVVGRTDAHLWFGWGHGDERDLARFAAT